MSAGRPKVTLADETVRVITAILTRYETYGRYIKYPGDWGERAFRGWLVYEFFHAILGWPIPSIVFGEQFDVLFVNERLIPVIYLETKKPHRDLADEDYFIKRTPSFPTIQYALLTDGHEWLRRDIITGGRVEIKLASKTADWDQFLRPLKASDYWYEVKV